VVRRVGKNQSFGKGKLVVLTLLFILFSTLLLSITLGAVSIHPLTIFKIIVAKIPFMKALYEPSWQRSIEVIVLSIRLPRVLQGALIGASLAISGVVIQSLFKNPMADPFVIGISSGAALGASIAIIFRFDGVYTLPFLAFIGATSAAFIVYNIARASSGIRVETLLLSGIAVAYFFSSITSFLLYSAGEALHRIIFWLMGGLWASSWIKISIITPLFLLSFGSLQFFSRDLNAMLLGEEPAHHLGIDVEAIKKIILISASLLAGVAVAFAGTIGFVGLIIPHITRLLVGPDHRILLPSSALVGAIFLVLSDALARVVIAPAEIPVGIITAFFGAPFFIYLLRTKRRTI
jgi:iron complex transport system permease protein